MEACKGESHEIQNYNLNYSMLMIAIGLFIHTSDYNNKPSKTILNDFKVISIALHDLLAKGNLPPKIGGKNMKTKYYYNEIPILTPTTINRRHSVNEIAFVWGNNDVTKNYHLVVYSKFSREKILELYNLCNAETLSKIELGRSDTDSLLTNKKCNVITAQEFLEANCSQDKICQEQLDYPEERLKRKHILTYRLNNNSLT